MAEDLPEGQMLFTLKELSDYLKISISSLHRWRRRGQLVAHKVGKQWRVHRAEASRLYRGTIPPAPEPRLIMPDEGHEARRPWSSLLESADMVEFVELKLVQMALNDEDESRMDGLVHGLTTAELQQYCAALVRVLAKSQAVLEARVSQAE